MVRSTLIATTFMSVIACAGPAKAAIIITATEVGGGIVISGSGTANLAGLTKFSANPSASTPVINPQFPLFQVGANALVDVYQVLQGPDNFGPGVTSNAFSLGATGDLFGINTNFTNIFLTVPAGYVSGDPLNGTNISTMSTFASLGMTPGTYVWTWGTGANADSLTLRIGPGNGPGPDPDPSVVMPEPSTLVLTGVCLICGLGVRLRQRRSV